MLPCLPVAHLKGNQGRPLSVHLLLYASAVLYQCDGGRGLEGFCV